MKVLLCKVWSVTAESVDDAVAEAKKEDKSRSVVYGSASLRTLPHPVHLAEVENAYGAIGESKK